MTSMVSWLSVDSRGHSSMYIASDSRISWSDSVGWNCARKVFSSKAHPIIFGYVGNVLFPSLVLGQLTSYLDQLDRIPFAEDLWEEVKETIKNQSSGFPVSYLSGFEIIMGIRSNSKLETKFKVASLIYNSSAKWSDSWIDLPTTSDIIRNIGSGSKSIQSWYGKWQRSSQGGTSRSVFSAFCDSLSSGEDSQSGGAPQLVGIYRVNSAKDFGVIYNEGLYFLGLNLDSYKREYEKIEWRNNLFEICSPNSKLKKSKAQGHGKPREIN